MTMTVTNKKLLIYSYTHFTIDFACFFYLYSRLFNANDLVSTTSYFFLYNALAFGLQAIFGLLLDKHPSLPLGLIGCILVLTGLSININVILSLILITLGNAFFHVEGGRDSLVNGGSLASRAGVFVSFGALGVMAGTLLSSSSIYIPIICLIIGIILCYYAELKHPEDKQNTQFDLAAKIKPIHVVILTIICIIVRSFTGPLLSGSMSLFTSDVIIYVSFASFIGKYSGGYLADKFGCKLTGISALVLSLVLYFLGIYTNLIFIFLSVVAFNIVMPISVCVLTSVLKDKPGFSFGITTMGLLLGTLPGLFTTIEIPYNYIAIVFSMIIATICLAVSTNNKVVR